MSTGINTGGRSLNDAVSPEFDGHYVDDVRAYIRGVSSPTGACCVADNTCFSTDAADCFQLPGRSFGGAGTECTPFDDCDSNGVLDVCDIAFDPGEDCDGNGLIDFCEIDANLQCYSDEFDDADGTIDPEWLVETTGPFIVEEAAGGLQISRPSGLPDGFQVGQLRLAEDVIGDFDIQVDYRAASINRVNGVPGNQIQLNVFGLSQPWFVVRSDEVNAGDNYHMFNSDWIPPVPGIATTDLAGTLRVVRQGNLLFGYYKSPGDLDWNLIATDSLENTPVSITIALQSNGTTDAISVEFDNFKLNPSECALDMNGNGILDACE